MHDFSDIFSPRVRTALATGGSRGIGRIFATGLLQQGAEVIAQAAVFLTSRAGDYVLDATLVVYGGWPHTRNCKIQKADLLRMALDLPAAPRKT
jgi:NAD(P)-dependent dehydrogenase (short-subunit alcohol dehydrogenase family)